MAPARQRQQELELIEFPDAQAWERWLETNHASSPGAWLTIAKKGAPRRTPTYAEALDVALCYGWIDGQKGALDESFWRQRFTRRGPKSKWSQINCEKATELIAGGRMQPPGQEQVDRAKEDGRWESAYEPQSRIGVPDDFQDELDRNPEAKAFFDTLRGANRYAFLYRIHDAKRPETRARRIATFIAMLNEHKTLHGPGAVERRPSDD